MSRSSRLEILRLIIAKNARKSREFSREQCNELYDAVLAGDNREAERQLCKTDLFFLLSRACKRRDADQDWIYARCREVEANPDGMLDLWARDHYKSTIITFAKTIQDILCNPEITAGIFSHTRPIAKGFLDQIKRELESNERLEELFPDVLYARPQSEAPRWSLDHGIVVKRKTNPKEATIEAWGLVDGQPTGKHFALRVYDDVVTLASVSTPEQIKKVTLAWEMSLNLGAHEGRARTIGTRYHIGDTYRVMIDRESVIPRIHTATHNGEMDGEPVLLSREKLLEKRRDMGPYTFGTQMLQNPVADKSMSFKTEWLSFYDRLGDTNGWNIYIVADPASEKKTTSDYTVMAVIGLAPDKNYYLIDAIRDRINLTQRAQRLIELHRKHKPSGVGYERYGMQADVEHIRYVQEQLNYRFNITELGGQIPKVDRIKKLVPIFEQKRFYLPKSLPFVDYEGRAVDFVKAFMTDEYLAFPVCVHDDMLDCIARILDPQLNAGFPKEARRSHAPRNAGGKAHGWMAS